MSWFTICVRHPIEFVRGRGVVLGTVYKAGDWHVEDHYGNVWQEDYRRRRDAITALRDWYEDEEGETKG